MLIVFTLPLLFLATLAGAGICLWLYGVLADKAWSVRQILLRSGVGAVAGVALLGGATWSLQKIKLDAQDIYGTYRVDRDFFPGRQADWQHDHYELIIAEGGTIILTEYYEGGGFTADTGRYEWVDSYVSAPRLRILPTAENHHVIETSPTLYREPWGFYYVFRSPRYGNMFFRKQAWWQ